jgi:hypothetical protein
MKKVKRREHIIFTAPLGQEKPRRQPSFFPDKKTIRKTGLKYIGIRM